MIGVNNRQSLANQRFGLLTVLEDSGQRKGSSILWRCRCDCGGEILAIRNQLVGGDVQSCGCVPRPERPRVTDLIGRRFGLLTVLEDSGQREGGRILWRCRCDCGGETLATRQRLVGGSAASCGCVPRQYASRGQAEDLTGRQFGELTALRRVENTASGKVRWLCRCSCGKELVMRAGQLKSGGARSCGCTKCITYNRYDLTGRRFGRLTALYRIPERPNYWHCRCDCGNECDVYSGSLLHGQTRSCGCWCREQSGRMHEHMHFQDGTCLEVLRHACLDTGRNKTGFRGITLLKNGRYRAYIGFQGKRYTLGRYASFERAVQARLEAEDALHAGYIKAFEEYEEKAKAAPSWAEDHPFYYQVTRENGTFRVQTNEYLPDEPELLLV